MVAILWAAWMAAQVDGRVVHALTQKPVPRAEVLVVESDSQRRVAFTTTDQQGFYRFENLPAGRVRLRTQRARFVTNTFSGVLDLEPATKIEGLRLEVAPAAAITGRVLDADGDPMERVQMQILRGMRMGGRRYWVPFGGTMTDDRGEFRLANLEAGEYLVFGEKEDSSYRKTYFPDGSSVESARPIRLQAGEERTGLVLTMPLRSKGVIRGVYKSSERTSLVVRRPLAESSVAFQREIFVPLDPQSGAFEIRGLEDGDYQVLALQNRPKPAAQIVASAELRYRGQDVDPLVLEPSGPVAVAGKVVWEGRPAQQAVQVALAMPEMGVNSYVPSVKAAGPEQAFHWPEVVPGRYRLRVDLGKEKGFVRKIRRGDQEMEGDFLDVTQAIEDLTVVVSTEMATLSGTVEGLDPQRPPGSIVVERLGPEVGAAEEEADWKSMGSGLPPWNQKGEYRLDALRPGRYRIYAVEGVGAHELREVEWRRKVAHLAREIQLGPGEKRTLAVPVIARELLHR